MSERGQLRGRRGADLPLPLRRWLDRDAVRTDPRRVHNPRWRLSSRGLLYHLCTLGVLLLASNGIVGFGI